MLFEALGSARLQFEPTRATIGTMSADRVLQLAPLLDAAVAAVLSKDFQHIASVAEELQSQNPDGPQPEIDLIAAGLRYEITPPQRRDEPFGVFGPARQFDGSAYPKPVSVMDADELAIWADALDASGLPAVRSRLADLLWAAKYGDSPYLFAQEAIDSYVTAAHSTFGEPIMVADGLERAHELAREIRDAERTALILDTAEEQVRVSLRASDDQPGVTLHLIKMLASVSREEVRPVVFELLAAAEERYGSDPWHSSSIQEIRSRLVEPAERPALWKRTVQAFAEEARRSTGLRRFALLQNAIEVAVAQNLRNEADALRAELQAIPVDDFDLHKISVTQTVAGEELDGYIQDVIGSDSLENALVRLGSNVPSGDAAANVEFARQLIQDHPLGYLATVMRMGPENTLVRKLSTPEQHEAQAVIDNERLMIGFFGLLAIEMLDGIAAAYGPVSHRAEWFNSDLIDEQVVLRIRTGLRHYEEGDYDSAVSVLAPRLERVLRRMAAAIGLVVTRTPTANGRPGGVKGLGEILDSLKDQLPADSHRYLLTLLCEPTAQNLRNRVGHGLADEFTQAEAALLVQAFCHVRRFALTTNSESAAATPPLRRCIDDLRIC